MSVSKGGRGFFYLKDEPLLTAKAQRTQRKIFLFCKLPVPGMRANVKYHRGWRDLDEMR